MADSATPSTGDSNARRAALAGLALGLAIALAANLTYAVPRGPVTVGLGLVAPLVLPVVLYLRTTFSVGGFWQRVVRELATLAVAGPAAAVSYSHTFNLVLDAHEPWILAVLAPLSSDGLAGMATLALHRLRQTAGTVDVSAVAARQAMGRLYEQLGTTTIPRRPTAKPRPGRKAPTPEAEAPARLATVGGTDIAKAARARELMSQGVPKSTAYRRAGNGD